MQESVIKEKIEKLEVRRASLKKKRKEIRETVDKTLVAKDKNLKRLKKRLRRVHHKKSRLSGMLDGGKKAVKGED
ncbi:MAG: hypothetical protein ACYCRD_00865 [Leptospirillum sp.]